MIEAVSKPFTIDWTSVTWTETDYQELAEIIELCEDRDTFLAIKSCYPIEAMRRSWRYLTTMKQDYIRSWLAMPAQENAA